MSGLAAPPPFLAAVIPAIRRGWPRALLALTCATFPVARAHGQAL